MEDFVDEDTGEVVSIERNEVIIDRETVIEKEHIDDIIDSGSKTVLLHKEDVSTSEYAIIYNTSKRSTSLKKKLLFIFIDNFVMPSRQMRKQQEVLLINYFSQSNAIA